jgi:hypothetical protein
LTSTGTTSACVRADWRPASAHSTPSSMARAFSLLPLSASTRSSARTGTAPSSAKRAAARSLAETR